MQTRVHLLKVCREWTLQHKVRWAEVQKETGVEEKYKKNNRYPFLLPRSGVNVSSTKL